MCGISGVFNLNQPVDLHDYYAAHLRLRHRGRDDEGFFAVNGEARQFYRGDDSASDFHSYPHVTSLQAANLVLGHRRLSIIDLSPAGHQPMSDPSGRYTVVYNGEIYNYIELRAELQQMGYHFTTQSDTEVLLAAYAAWGAGCFNRLNGMWALALYDAHEHSLILCRDRFGVKPLYYTWVNGSLYFASEVKFLLSFLPDLRVNETRAAEYLVQTLVDHHPETLFEGIYQLPPAHYAAITPAGLALQAFWQLPNRQNPASFAEACEELSALLTSAVQLRLRSDVPIGSLLSGGLDSTAIVCIIQRLLTEQNAANAYDAFSAVYDEAAYSERSYIEATIAQTGMPVHWITPNPEVLTETLPQLLYHQEFPIRSLAVYAQWEIMRRVRQTPIIVLLDGQGSDEIFGGYTAHYFALAGEYLRRLSPLRAWRELRHVARRREVPLARGLASAVRELIRATPLNRMMQSRSISYLNTRYTPAMPGQPQTKDIFHNALYRNLTFSALPEYLRYEDRNSMAFTLESRLPFMDYRLVEWAFSLPPDYRIGRAASKRVLRETVRPFIPPAVANRQDKMGFTTPQEQWQRGAMQGAIDKVFTQDLQARFPFINQKTCAALYEDYRQGRNNDWGWVWRMASLAWWHEQWWK